MMVQRATNDTLDIDGMVAELRERHGKDFSLYRPSCLARRFSLRMATLSIEDVESYLRYLDEHPEEIERLLETVTIHVTEFFRDPDVWSALGDRIIPEIVARKLSSRGRSIRIWSAGCSTGEETYSAAIVLHDRVASRGAGIRPSVIGTDISPESCRIGRGGIYPGRRLRFVPEALLRRYFTPIGENFGVAPEIKAFVHFRIHNLFARSPFTLLDVIMCRNVLIHFENDTRGEILERFNHSLDDGGYLVLGKSEAIMGDATDFFDLVDPKTKIYRKRSVARS